MLNIKDYLNYENVDKQYLVKLKSEEIVPAYINDAKINNQDFYSFYKYETRGVIDNNSIDCILRELPDDFTIYCTSCKGVKLDIHKALNGETTCESCLEKQKELTKFKTDIPNVYKYDSIEGLQELHKLLNYPIPDNLDQDLENNTLIVDDLKYHFGLVYLWSHWDDFSDNPDEYCAVIDVGRLFNIK